MARVGPKQGQDQYPRPEHSAKLIVKASINAIFQDQVAANANAERQQRGLKRKRVTEGMGTGAHDTVMVERRFFNPKKNSFITLVAPRLNKSA